MTGVRKVLYGVRKVSYGVRKVSDDVRKVSDGVRKVSDGFRKVSDGGRNVPAGMRKLSDGARKLSDGVKKCPGYILKDSWHAQSILKRLLPRPEILTDSWQEDYVIHMEIKDLHVAIVFSPICGPMPLMSFPH